MVDVSENLRYLLWRAGVKRKDWVIHLRDWGGTSESRALDLLQNKGSIPTVDEQQRIEQETGTSGEELLYTRLIEAHKPDIMMENLAYLFDDVEHGQKGLLARELGLHPTSISRWLARSQRPTEHHLRDLAKKFGLDGINLEVEPVFLSLDPKSSFQKRAWLLTRIEQLSLEEANSLYALLAPLLRKS